MLAALLLLVGAGLLARRSPPGDPVERPVGPGELAVSSEPARSAERDTGLGTWRAVASAPQGGRVQAAGAWTGRELVVWGGRSGTGLGERPRPDGAAYDPVSDAWRLLPPAPLTTADQAAAVWTGTEVIVVAGLPPEQLSAAAYDPALDRWRRLPPVPLPARQDSVTVWTGQELLVWGGTSRLGGAAESSPAEGARYDPRTDAWRLTAPSPLPSLIGQGVWTGRELLVYDRFVGLAYDVAADAWRRLPDTPHPLRDPGRSLVWTGSALLVAGDYHDPGVYGLLLVDDEWVTVSLPHPLEREAPSVTAVPAGDRVVLLHSYRDGANGEGLLWSAAGDWESLAPSPVLARSGSTTVWTGTELIMWGGADRLGVAADGAVWTAP